MSTQLRVIIVSADLVQLHTLVIFMEEGEMTRIHRITELGSGSSGKHDALEFVQVP